MVWGNRYINLPHYFMATDDPYTFEVYMYDELPKGMQEVVDCKDIQELCKQVLEGNTKHTIHTQW